ACRGVLSADVGGRAEPKRPGLVLGAANACPRVICPKRLHRRDAAASSALFRGLRQQFAGDSPQRPITCARTASGILSMSGTLNPPDATRPISPPHIRSQLQKQKLSVRRAIRAVPSSHWPNFAPRTNSVLSDTVGCGHRMPVAWPEPAPITM